MKRIILTNNTNTFHTNHPNLTIFYHDKANNTNTLHAKKRLKRKILSLIDYYNSFKYNLK